MEATISLNGDQYGELLRIISLLKETCNDVDVRGGIIRQRSNDNSCIYEIDLNPLLEDINLPISNIKQKIDLFKIFVGQDVTVSVDNETYTTITKLQTKLKDDVKLSRSQVVKTLVTEKARKLNGKLSSK